MHDTAAARPHRWSTDDVAPAQRLEYWVDAISEGFLAIEATSPVRQQQFSFWKCQQKQALLNRRRRVAQTPTPALPQRGRESRHSRTQALAREDVWPLPPLGTGWDGRSVSLSK